MYNSTNFRSVLGLLLCLLGGVVIFGWMTYKEHLVQIHSSLAPMQFNTALGFISLGVGLCCLSAHYFRISVWVGFFLFIFTLVTFFQYLFPVDFNIDQLFFKHYIETKTSHIGRMAPNTAICFILGSTLIMLFSASSLGRIRLFIAQIFSILLVSLSLASFLGYLLSLETLFGWADLTRMALHTSLGFLFFGIEEMRESFSRGEEGRRNQGFFFKVLFVDVFFILLTVILLNSIEKQEVKFVRQIVSERVEYILNNIERKLNTDFLAVKRMSRRWTRDLKNSKRDWMKDAEQYLVDHSNLNSMFLYSFADEDLLHKTKSEGVEYDKQKSVILSYINSRVVGRKELIHIQGYMYYFVPLSEKGNVIGCIVAVYDWNQTVDKLLPPDFNNFYRMEIVDDDSTLLWLNMRKVKEMPRFEITQRIKVQGETWELHVWPTKYNVDSQDSGLAELVLLLGIFLSSSIAVAFSVWLANQESEKRNIENEKRLKAILQFAGEGIYGLDCNGTITFINQAALDVLEYPTDELTGNSINSIVGDCTDLIFETLTTGQSLSEVEKSFFGKSGVEKPVLFSCTAILGYMNKVIGAVVVFRDLTTFKKEVELKELLYTFSFDNDVSLNYKINRVLDLLIKYLELDSSFIIQYGDLVDQITYSFSEVKEFSASTAILKGKLLNSLETQPNTTEYWTSNSTQAAIPQYKGYKFSSLIRVPLVVSGSVYGTLIVCSQDKRDGNFTERERSMMQTTANWIESEIAKETYLKQIEVSEQNLHRAVDQLTKSNQDLEQFAYIASHDLSAPLRVIKNAVNWLEEDIEDKLTDDSRENLSLVHTRLDRMKALLSDLLEYSRVGRVKVKHGKKIKGDQFISEVLELVHLPEGFNHKISPNFNEIEVDVMPLKQIMINLINNAVKHHNKPTGQIEIDVTELEDCFEFSITDDGPGIPQEFQTQVFEMFKTLQPRDKVEGSGMGLAIVKKYVEAMGGQIRLQSKVGEGSAFIFDFPKE